LSHRRDPQVETDVVGDKVTSVARRQGWPFPSFPDDQLVRVDVAEVLDRKRQAVMEAHASQ
jgi:hypothetical protein